MSVQSLEDFYLDTRRKRSPELKFGAGWRSPELEGWECTIFWVRDTKELCALWSPVLGLRSDGPISRWILGVPPHTNVQTPDEDELTVEVLAIFDQEDIESVLNTWEEHQEASDGFDWVSSSVRSARRSL